MALSPRSVSPSPKHKGSSGEALRDAARRELMEETGIEAELQAIIDVAEVIRLENAQVTAHYAIGRSLLGGAGRA
jgi:8-oxo-dGTP pyrophosphatase MutT (NUDIX family)